MFKHLLLATDGSPASGAIIRECIRFAHETGAGVTGFHAIPEFHVLTYDVDMLEDTREQYRKDSEEHARICLGAIEAAAREAGVPCDTAFATSDHPYEAIIQAADAHRCDLIVMAPHGHKGMKGLFIGSETQKVLAHGHLPVLVYRQGKAA